MHAMLNSTTLMVRCSTFHQYRSIWGHVWNARNTVGLGGVGIIWLIFNNYSWSTYYMQTHISLFFFLISYIAGSGLTWLLVTMYMYVLVCHSDWPFKVF